MRIGLICTMFYTMGVYKLGVNVVLLAFATYGHLCSTEPPMLMLLWITFDR